jgi:hypothetical protein
MERSGHNLVAYRDRKSRRFKKILHFGHFYADLCRKVVSVFMPSWLHVPRTQEDNLEFTFNVHETQKTL